MSTTKKTQKLYMSSHTTALVKKYLTSAEIKTISEQSGIGLTTIYNLLRKKTQKTEYNKKVESILLKKCRTKLRASLRGSEKDLRLINKLL